MAFCDFCPCEDCQHGTEHIKHAPTSGGHWICDVCWRYDVCAKLRAPDERGRKRGGPCERDGKAYQCEHRPVIVGEWVA